MSLPGILMISQPSPPSSRLLRIRRITPTVTLGANHIRRSLSIEGVRNNFPSLFWDMRFIPATTHRRLGGCGAPLRQVLWVHQCPINAQMLRSTRCWNVSPASKPAYIVNLVETGR